MSSYNLGLTSKRSSLERGATESSKSLDTRES